MQKRQAAYCEVQKMAKILMVKSLTPLGQQSCLLKGNFHVQKGFSSCPHDLNYLDATNNFVQAVFSKRFHSTYIHWDDAKFNQIKLKTEI